MAFLELASKRQNREKADWLALHALAAQGDKKSIEKALKELSGGKS
jgi:hypothetical protein